MINNAREISDITSRISQFRKPGPSSKIVVLDSADLDRALPLALSISRRPPIGPHLFILSLKTNLTCTVWCDVV